MHKPTTQVSCGRKRPLHVDLLSMCCILSTPCQSISSARDSSLSVRAQNTHTMHQQHFCLVYCRHAATVDSSSPASSTSQDASEVRQRLTFDLHESRFAETAEPDPLSSFQPQHAQQASVALTDSFQALNLGHRTHSSMSNSDTGLAHQLSAPPGSLRSMLSSEQISNAAFTQHPSIPSGVTPPHPPDRGRTLGSGTANASVASGHRGDKQTASPTRQALDR